MLTDVVFVIKCKPVGKSKAGGVQSTEAGQRQSTPKLFPCLFGSVATPRDINALQSNQRGGKTPAWNYLELDQESHDGYIVLGSFFLLKWEFGMNMA